MIALTTLAYEGLSYQVLDKDIHAIRFEVASRQTVTSLMALIERLYVETAEVGVVYLLVDSLTASLPMGVAIREGTQLEKRYPQHPTVYLALLHTNALAKLLEGMLRPLRINNQIRLFGPTEREQAIAWLRAKQAELAQHPRVEAER